MTTQLRDLLDDAAVSEVRPGLAAQAVARARHRQRGRFAVLSIGVAAATAAAAFVVWSPTGLPNGQSDAVQPSPGQAAVVPRLVPPLGNHLPSVSDQTVDRVSVAWTALYGVQAQKGTVSLLALDARDGQPVVVTGQVYSRSPVAVAPDGHAVAFIRSDCVGRLHSLAVFDLAARVDRSFGACDVETGPDGRLDSSTIAWSADSRFVAVVAQVPGGHGVAVYRADGAGLRQTMRVDASAVAWAPGGWAVRTGDGRWQLRDDQGQVTGVLPELSPGQPAGAVAFTADGLSLARAQWAAGMWRYRIDTWPIEPGQRTTGAIDQVCCEGDRWLVASGQSFLAAAGPYRNAAFAPGVAGVAQDTPLARVVATISSAQNRGLPTSVLAFTGDQTTGEQDVHALGVAGDLMVDPTFVATVPDDGHPWWEWQRLFLGGLAVLVAGLAARRLALRARRRGRAFALGGREC